ncbi:phosphoglycerate kinase [Candidatus Saccharibacteria bacterium]|jgi:3-phosphoglycerate kinase|nr:phosphoglycerate kinase [Candidatus Saccharibacteria bacterium]
MFTKKTIRDIDLGGKRVLMRADYNVPIEHGRVTSDFRITQSLPTIQFLLEKNVRLIICSHLGRPEGKPDPACSLRPVAEVLSDVLGRKVLFVNDCIGEEAQKAVDTLEPGQILLLENLRFHPEEEANDDGFAKQLAAYADVFVQDGFGVVHRAHASTDAITKHLPSVAGLLLEKEVDTLTDVMSNPARPLAAVLGGAKIADKLEILHKLIDIADFVAIGGAMANTFLAAQGMKIGKSKYDPDELDLAREILEKAEEKAKSSQFTFFLPHDGVVTTKLDKAASTRLVDWDAAFISEIQNYPKKVPASAHTIADDELLVDVGPLSAAFIAGGVQLAKTVIWNGTLGITETPALHGPIGPYARGTELLIDALTGTFGSRPFVVVGGGDTTGYIEQRQLTKAFNHVSTGGGASLELMAGRPLPGVEALQDK